MNRFSFAKLGRTLLMLTAVIAFGLMGCGGDDNPFGGAVVKGAFTDNRDGKTYKTVPIGGKTWMAENLNIKTADSRCYGEDGQVFVDYDEDDNEVYSTLSSSEIKANCNKYGRLYTWDAAKTACPAGWHLPARDEWDHLAESVGGTKNYRYDGLKHDYLNVGKKLKSTSGWYDNSNGTDDFGFSALPGGVFRYSYSFFCLTSMIGVWWTADEYEHTEGLEAHYRVMSCCGDGYYDGDDLIEYYNTKSDRMSVRCVKDE